MSSLNKQVKSQPVIAKQYPATVKNHYGADVPAQQDANKTLTRLTLANLLWEDQFYIDGKSSYEVLKSTVSKADPTFVASLAKKARTEFKLRHVPLALMRELARNGKMKAEDLTSVISRPDEISEFLSLYWKEKKQPISNQVKKGLGNALMNFKPWQLAKWDKNSAAISLRDVMFLTHPKPKDASQAEVFKKLANEELEAPDTWEVKLSGGADKKETFSQLMAEKKLGALAFLRNLRNMLESGISQQEIYAYGANLDVSKVLPFRYVAAYRVVPQMKDMLEALMYKSLAGMPKLKGRTVLLVDVSGSMGAKVSDKSELNRFDAASALAVLCRELCEDVQIVTFSDKVASVNRTHRGFELLELRYTQPNSGTDLAKAVNSVNANFSTYDRLIVITDEQGTVPNKVLMPKSYLINVAAYKNGIDAEGRNFHTISGFSEAVFTYIEAYEQQAALITDL